MDYEIHIKRTIDYIEENLHEDISLENLAEIACFSPYHFHRIFQALVGESVMEYVRKRRLTYAAERLYYSNEKVLDIAIEVGFQYQVSFNRSFKKVFGVSPVQYRNAKSLSGPLRGKAYLHPKQLTGGSTMELKFVTKPAFHIIGYELKTKTEDGQNNKDIPVFWQHYIQNDLGSKIPGPIKKYEELGICSDFCSETGEFVYVIGKEVANGAEAPEGMSYRSYPEQEYAVFTTPKATDETFSSAIQSTWQHIFAEWFPHSDYEYSGVVDFELYDERCFGAEKVMDIYIPVKKKNA
ncbi:AraC family transcriptional regulator [Bacillus alkalisoli]|uniref:AraC family transcriptional regulator n=1 Tax=Bacillus alkalisoli TaxID=2011008 RepID=UPI000C23BFBA|nr:AraC family transcriptional regulator [Bacillus alkalisoli]